jgi:predicted patatin/cPLA2 family phospholipase
LDRSQRYNEKIAIIDELEKKGEIFIIRPEVDTISHLEENIDILNDFYLHGFSLMEKRFTEFQNYVKKQSQ